MERKDIGNEKERTCNNKRGLHASVREIGRVRPETSVQPARKSRQQSYFFRQRTMRPL